MVLWETWQMNEIRRARSSAIEARSDARSAKSDIEFAEDAIERLVLVNRAMWEVLGERLGVTEQELLAKVEEIDLRDGARDGRYRQPPRDCAKCGRTLGQRRLVCLYCGEPEAGGDPFRTV